LTPEAKALIKRLVKKYGTERVRRVVIQEWERFEREQDEIERN
jgi:hypothetical protein